MKHAYLIMAHNEPYILESLIKLIDDERNDIYIHVDKKWQNFDFDYFKNIVQRSNMYFTERLDVRWGTYDQIECELLLLKKATENNKYEYYHLLSGGDMPITSQDIIHDFFDKNQGKEFISFDYHDKILPSDNNRIKYYHVFNRNLRNNNKVIKNTNKVIYKFLLNVQKILKINRLKRTNLKIRKGANWFSITDDLARYVLNKQGEIQKIFGKSLCADELFLQTIVYNSEFYNNLISYKDNDTLSIKRYIDWKRGNPYTFRINDFDELINSNCFFARKFSKKTDKEILDKIYNYVKCKEFK